MALGFVLGLFDFRTGLSLQSRIESQFTTDASDLTMVIIQPSEMTEIVFKEVEEALKSGEVNTEELLIEIPYLENRIKPEDQPELEGILSKYLSTSELRLCLLYMRALGDVPEVAALQLEALAASPQAPRYANQILALIASGAKLYNKAYPYLLKEGKFPEATWARRQAVKESDGFFDQQGSLGIPAPGYRGSRL